MRRNGIADYMTVTHSVSAGAVPNEYPPDNYPNQNPSANAEHIAGTIESVDTRNQLIDISTSQNRYTLYYDSRTRVVYRDNAGYSPADLERGDQVDVTTFNTNGQVVADTITVTYNVRQ